MISLSLLFLSFHKVQQVKKYFFCLFQAVVAAGINLNVTVLENVLLSTMLVMEFHSVLTEVTRHWNQTAQIQVMAGHRTSLSFQYSRAGRYGVRIPAGTRYFSLLQNVQTNSGTHQAPYSIGTWVLSRPVKRPGCEVDHLPLSTAEVKNEWSYTSTSLVCLHGVYRNKFTFLYFTHT